MGISLSKYLPKQMNGPIVNAEMQAIDQSLENSDAIINYLYSLSLTAAKDTELESIGCLIGYPRPLVPEGFSDENIMLLGSLPLEEDTEIGLSTVNSEIGGRLSTTEKSETGYMDLGLYRKMVEKVAILKRYGITLYSIDEIASLISKNYTLSWDSNQDLVISYTESIGYKNIWILTQLFYRISTEPQVKVVTQGD